MPISAEDILSLASSTLEAADTECKLRMIVGRAYYAVYHRAYDFHCGLPQPGAPAPRGGVHEVLWHALTNPTISDSDQKIKSRKVGYLGKDLHLKRVIADYRRELTVTRIDAEHALAQAERLFSEVEQ